jgi:aldehyde:ferredoxin oxidoreductase
MNLNAKKVLVIDLNDQTSEVKSYVELHNFIGGIGLGVKLYEIFYNTEPVILSVGPLNGFFPYASKTSALLNNEGVLEDTYIGGNLSLRIRYSGLDSIVVTGTSDYPVVIDINNTRVNFHPADTDIGTLGLPGKRSTIKNAGKNLLLNDYFTTPENFLGKSLQAKNVIGMVVTGTEIYSPKEFDRYQELYYKILNRKADLSVDEGKHPSCGNCPMGCGKSQQGEIGGNVLIHSMVACQYADSIYNDIGTLFSCLNTLGYGYKHEDIEYLPVLIEETLKRIS